MFQHRNSISFVRRFQFVYVVGDLWIASEAVGYVATQPLIQTGARRPEKNIHNFRFVFEEGGREATYIESAAKLQLHN